MRDSARSTSPTPAQLATTFAYLINAVSAIILLAVLVTLLIVHTRPSDEDYVEVASAIPVIG